MKCTSHLNNWEQLEQFQLSNISFGFLECFLFHRKKKQGSYNLRNHRSLYMFLQVCLEKLQDLQLALVISRLYESEFETASTYKKILQRHVLGQEKQVQCLSMSPSPLAIAFYYKNALFPQTTQYCLTSKHFDN